MNRLLARVSSLIYSDSSDGNDDHEQLEEVTSLSRKHRLEARAKWGVGWQEGNEDKHRAGGNWFHFVLHLELELGNQICLDFP